MIRAAGLAPCLLLCLAAPSGQAIAGDEIFERDLSTPFLQDDDDRFLRDRDLPGPLRRSWPYADAPERAFKAVEARRACHARALFEIGKAGGDNVKAIARLKSARDGALRYSVKGRYTAEIDGGTREIDVSCTVSSRAVISFSTSE